MELNFNQAVSRIKTFCWDVKNLRQSSALKVQKQNKNHKTELKIIKAVNKIKDFDKKNFFNHFSYMDVELFNELLTM